MGICRTLLAPLAAAALLVAGTVLAQAPEPSVRRLTCGGYQVVPSGIRRESGAATRLTIQKGGRLLVTLTDWAISGVQCEDLDADKMPELLVRTFSGGAHCCETVRVYALADTPRLLLTYEANNAIGVQARDLNGDGKKELLLGDDAFAYFDDLCYACAPSSLPLVACEADGRFQDCTAKFPELLRGARDRYLGRLGPVTGEEGLKEAEGAALGVLAISELLGEEDKGLQMVKDASPGDLLQAWLQKALPQVRDWAAARGKKLKNDKQ